MDHRRASPKCHAVPAKTPAMPC